jgi:hypothetical protein
MADVFEALLGSAPPDQKALIEGLRKRAAYGQLAAASGIGPLAKVGATDVASARNEAEAISNARRTDANREEERAFRRWQQEQANEQRGLDRALRAQLDARDAADRAARAAEKDQLSAAQLAVQDRHEQSMVAQLSSRIDTSKLGELEQMIGNADEVLREYKDEEGIPGTGGIFNVEALGTGTAATYVADALGAGDGPTMRGNQAKLAGLKNLITLIRSGAAVTMPEMNRLQREFSSLAFNTAADYKFALQRINETYAQMVKNQLAGYSPEVINRFRAQGGQYGKIADRILTAPPGPTTGAAQPGLPSADAIAAEIARRKGAQK